MDVMDNILMLFSSTKLRTITVDEGCPALE